MPLVFEVRELQQVVDDMRDRGMATQLHRGRRTHLFLEHVHRERFGHDVEVIGECRHRALDLELTSQRHAARPVS
jgi:hypothetical protein